MADIHVSPDGAFLMSDDMTPRKVNGRRQVRMVLTRERYECLQRWCRARDITVTSLVEAFAQSLLDAEQGGAPPAPPATALQSHVIDLAHQITVDRRRRGVVEES